MKLVVDASVAVKWVFAEPGSEIADQLLEGWIADRFEILAPPILPVEAANAIWKRALRGALTPGLAERALAELMQFCPQLVESATLLAHALELAIKHRASVYDGLYVALGVQERCRLVTADQELVRAFGSAFPQVILLRDWKP